MQYIVNDEDVFVGERIDKFLSEQNEEFTRSYIQKLIEEENVLVNNIGSLVTNQDLLKGKAYITDEELEELDYEEVNYLYNEIEEEMEM